MNKRAIKSQMVNMRNSIINKENFEIVKVKGSPSYFEVDPKTLKNMIDYSIEYGMSEREVANSVIIEIITDWKKKFKFKDRKNSWDSLHNSDVVDLIKMIKERV